MRFPVSMAAGLLMAGMPTFVLAMQPDVRATSPAEDESLAAALALFSREELDAQMMQMALASAQAGMDAQLDAQRKQGIELPDSLVARIRQITFEEVKSMVEAMSPSFRLDVARIYAKHFTAEELRELKRFTDSAVGRKSQALAPKLFSELVRIGSAATAERSVSLRAKIEAMVRAWVNEQAANAGPDT